MRVMPGSGLQATLVLLVATGLGCASLTGARAYRSGSVALERGDTALAISELKRATELMPGTSEIHNQLGLAHAQAGQLDRAVEEFGRAAQLDCANQAAVVNLALARAQRSRLGAPESRPPVGVEP